jgi:hypothetical protein
MNKICKKNNLIKDKLNNNLNKIQIILFNKKIIILIKNMTILELFLIKINNGK